MCVFTFCQTLARKVKKHCKRGEAIGSLTGNVLWDS